MLSSDGITEYIVRRYPYATQGDDIWTCTCQGYRYQSLRQLHYQCKHISKMIDGMVAEYREVAANGPHWTLRSLESCN